MHSAERPNWPPVFHSGCATVIASLAPLIPSGRPLARQATTLQLTPIVVGAPRAIQLETPLVAGRTRSVVAAERPSNDADMLSIDVAEGFEIIDCHTPAQRSGRL